MKNASKTETQHVNELSKLRQRIAQLEACETSRKHTEEMLYESEERNRALFERLPDCMYVHDFEGNLIDANAAALNLLGYKKEDIASLNFISLLSQNQVPRAMKAIEEIKETGSQKGLTEYKLKRKNGEYVCVETKGFLIHLDGESHAIQGIARDITERKQTEKVLRESEEKYRSLVERANDGICIIQEGTIQYLNPRLGEMWGGTVAEIIGTSFIGYLDTDSLVEVQDRYAKRMAGMHIPSIYEAVLRDKNDNKLYVEINGALITYNGKSADLVLIRDISDRKQMQKSLQKSEERYRSLFEESRDAIFISTLEGTLVDCNQAMLSLFGVTREKMVGIDVRKIYIDPADRKRFQREIEEKGSVVDYAVKFHKKDEKVMDCLLTSTVRLDDGKNIIGYQGIIRDISERKQTEEKLRESEEQYRAIFENAVEGIFQSTTDGKFLKVNPALASMYGFNSPQEMITAITDIGQQLYANPEDRVRFKTFLQKYGFVKDFESEQRHNNGHKMWISVNAKAIKDEAGNILYYDGIFQDITERKQAEEQLKQSYEELKASMEGTIEAIAFMAETRDPYTAGHQRRVAKLASAIAEELNLPKEQIEMVRVAGILHDIGKVSVPAEILAKPGKLNELEIGMIRTHPQVGREILKTLKLPWPICPIVLQHHERMDGSGYPKGISGEDISLEARILAVADVVEAMSSHRPYRPTLGTDKALEEISKNSGILYDTKVVDACLKLLSEKAFKYE